MIKVYVQNKPLFLADKTNPEIDEYLHRQTTISVDELNSSAVNTILQQLSRPDYYAGVLLHPNSDEAIDLLKDQFNVIKAAGGLVKTDSNEILLIFRRGKWDLPKGKQDEGEDIEACAIREVQEETGLNAVQIIEPIDITYHSYYEGDTHILKESHWYLMSAGNKENLSPQTEEDIEKCEWVSIENMPGYLTNMHASIIDVLKKHLG